VFNDTHTVEFKAETYDSVHAGSLENIKVPKLRMS